MPNKDKSGFTNAMKKIHSFDSVKGFWGLFNYLNLDKMPVGANLRFFKDGIQPTWEDPRNKNGGNLIVVTKPRELATVVFKEILLSIIGGDLDSYVNGIVLSVKAKDIIVQVWLPDTKTRKQKKVQDVATKALSVNCKELNGSKVAKVEWSWRAHPTAKSLAPLQQRRTCSLADDDPVTTSVPGGGDKRGMCGECVGTYRCAIM